MTSIYLLDDELDFASKHYLLLWREGCVMFMWNTVWTGVSLFLVTRVPGIERRLVVMYFACHLPSPCYLG